MKKYIIRAEAIGTLNVDLYWQVGKAYTIELSDAAVVGDKEQADLAAESLNIIAEKDGYFPWEAVEVEISIKPKGY
jgi:hypothetical protein